MHQVGLAEADPAVEEERVEGDRPALGDALGHAAGGGVGELVRLADDEVVEGAAPVERRGGQVDVRGHGRGGARRRPRGPTPPPGRAAGSRRDAELEAADRDAVLAQELADGVAVVARHPGADEARRRRRGARRRGRSRRRPGDRSSSGRRPGRAGRAARRARGPRLRGRHPGLAACIWGFIFGSSVADQGTGFGGGRPGPDAVRNGPRDRRREPPARELPRQNAFPIVGGTTIPPAGHRIQLRLTFPVSSFCFVSVCYSGRTVASARTVTDVLQPMLHPAQKYTLFYSETRRSGIAP